LKFFDPDEVLPAADEQARILRKPLVLDSIMGRPIGGSALNRSRTRLGVALHADLQLTNVPTKHIVDLGETLLEMPNRIGWIRWLPGLLTLRQYQAAWLGHDIVAGEC
jgi:hypothetical protein